jgi:AraC family transcriptional regulator
MSLRAYVTSRRLRLASDLLQNSQCSITVVAVDCGFYDLPHFDKAFRKTLGVSPQEFRRRADTRTPSVSMGEE